MRLGEEEGDADILKRFGGAFPGVGEVQAQRLQRVGGARLELAARLPCLATGTPQAATTSDTAVETLSV
jgi:hypothetical protein